VTLNFDLSKIRFVHF